MDIAMQDALHRAGYRADQERSFISPARKNEAGLNACLLKSYCELLTDPRLLKRHREESSRLPWSSPRHLRHRRRAMRKRLRRVLALVNASRSSPVAAEVKPCAAGPLVFNGTLQIAALSHAKDMAATVKSSTKDRRELADVRARVPGIDGKRWARTLPAVSCPRKRSSTDDRKSASL